jgi:SagB-type dehydrogenase family enzyme
MPLDRRRFLELTAGGLAGLRSGLAGADELLPRALRVHRETRNTLLGPRGRHWFGGPTPSVSRAKAYPGRPRLPLPKPTGGGGAPLDPLVRRFAPAPALEGEGLSLDSLSRLLHLSYGVTAEGPQPLRAAPSAGALYAGEVYVVAERVEGLAAGVYSYHAPTHTLVFIRSGPRTREVADAVEASAAIEGAPIGVLLTNVFLRYTHRYANRGYRYALIDSGHIGENLRLAAAGEGQGVVSPLRFHDDALNALLGIDGRSEAVCALHAIGRRADTASGPGARSFVEAHRAPGFAAPSGLSEPESYHLATKLAPGGSKPAREEPPASRGGRGAGELPARERPAATLAWTVDERRSAEHFLDEPVPLEDLAYLLDLAQGNPAGALAPGIELLVVAHRVRELEPGVYRYEPAARRLAPERSGDLRDALRRACGGQGKAATAALGFAMLADLERTAGRDRAYRDQLLEAGALGQRVYLGAEAIGLAARNLAAFNDDALNELLGVDGERRAVVHLTMVGPGD